MPATSARTASTDRYDYAAVTPETVLRVTEDGLLEADRLVARACEAAGPRTFENTIVPLSEAAAAAWRASGRGASLGDLHPDAAVRAAASSARERVGRWRSEVVTRAELAASVRAYAETSEAAGLAGARKRILDLWLRDLRRAGHGLDPVVRSELATLRSRLVELTAAFDRHLNDWSDAIELTAEDFDGLAPTFVAQLAAGAGTGSKSLPIKVSTVVPFLEQSTRRDLRELVLRRLLSVASDENRPVLEEVLAIRRRIAGLLGAPSWSQFANEVRMSGGAEAVREFLDRLLPPLAALAAEERAVMQRLLATDGIEGRVQAWDWHHCHDRQRAALGLDGSRLSEHLPFDAVLGGLFDLVREVFGVDVSEDPTVRAWHPDVRLFVMRDVATGEHLADCYLDPFARDGKTPGAWCGPLDPGSNRPGRPRRPPVLHLVTNFAPAQDGAKPLLQHYAVTVLFHEFGHALEMAVQRAEVCPVDAFLWHELDFVEAPSQILEHWAWAPEVIGRFARHHGTGESPPPALLEPLAAARRLNVGTSILWFAYKAVLDQDLHGPEPVDLDQAYRSAFAVTGFPFVEGTFEPSSFGHIATWQYDAGYYGYFWADVLGDDMFSAFRSEGLFSLATGRRYRSEVLEPTWTVPGRERVRNFLGREPSEKAYLERLGIVGAIGHRGRGRSRGSTA
jgi:Zn-dependent oligopeptidase